MSVLRLPDFLIIGAQKCGTSWIHHYLRQHSGLFLPREKEQSYFCWQPSENAPSTAEYGKYFAGATAAQRCGEATAAYFWTRTQSDWEEKPGGYGPGGYEPNIPGRVASELGADARLVLTLRDPVDRAVSGYFHHLNFGSATPDCALLDTPKRLGIVDIGFYGQHLANWLERFDAQQFHILDLQDDIAAQPERTLRGLFEFLGVETPFADPDAAHKIFPGSVRTSGPDGITGKDGAHVSAATIARLRSLYKQDVMLLSELSGRDFASLWGYR